MLSVQFLLAVFLRSLIGHVWNTVVQQVRRTLSSLIALCWQRSPGFDLSQLESYVNAVIAYGTYNGAGSWRVLAQ